MKTGIHFITFSCLLMFIFGYQNVDAQQNLAQEAYAIFEQSCLICHGENGSYTEALIIEHAALIDDGKVVPGDPDGSVFYQRLIETNVAKRMPQRQPPLDAEAIETIRQWILTGAPDWSDIPRPDTDFITTDVMLETIENHVNSLSSRDKSFARYFTLTHLYNAGETAEALQAYRRALSKLINSLSWGREVVKPQPIDAEETLFYIDLRDYEWDVRNDAWTQIEQVYPYKMTFDAPTQTPLREKLTTLQQEMNCEVPFVHVDWFLATASLPPLYHDILALPETDRELEAVLRVFVTANLQNAPGERVWRAGFNDSGVSRHNRVVERHTSSYGAYWKSYDFAGSAESQNIFTHPLDFTHDGGEIIFNLPNGLQAYYLVDGGGNRLDVAPTSIVSNPAASDPAVRNGLSCIGCHTQGMKTVEDEVRAVVDQAANPPFDKVRALDLYVEKTVMDELVEEDTQRYRDALEAAGGVFGGIEPIQRFYEVFHGSLSAAHAAAAVGLETETFLEKISKNVSLQNLLGVLVLENGTVKRDAWTSNFDEVIAALDSPDSILPPVEQRPERIPGAGVYIPDTNLRAAIAEALGKAASDVITVEKMETLTHLSVHNYFEPRKENINNLTGLEFATNLSYLHIGSNSVSDLSPLAGLIKLDFLDAQGNLISDISPLKGLTRLKGLILTGNLISDLSPLIGLTNLEELRANKNLISDFSPITKLTTLKGIWISGESLSDLSLLSGLINLEGVNAWDTSIEDISPLAELTKLRWLDFGRAPISNLSPLVGLTSLRKLKFYDCGIKDISALEGLTELIQITMPHNTISDLSPLERLIRLTYLELGHNAISDVSSLAELTNLETLWIGNNEISDVSPLAGLTNLKELNLNQNPITDFSPLEELFENTNILFGVAIPDPNLRAAIAEELGKGDDAFVSFTVEDMAALEVINAEGKGIKDLSGIEFATNLVHLNVRGNSITDLSPITGLNQINKLRLRGNLIPDFSGLAKLESLKELWISGEKISDLSSLAALTNLEGFGAWEIAIDDVSPLNGFTKLRWLELGHNSKSVSDISPLASLTGLKRLLLYGMGIEDISPLASLTGLKNLSIIANKVSDISPLTALSELEYLSLENNDIWDFSPIEDLFGKIPILTGNNPGFPAVGPIIEGPWLWVIAPITGMSTLDAAASGTDFLAQMSDSAVTELEIATEGAKEGETVGNGVWTVGKINASVGNINELVNATSLKISDTNRHIAYGSIILGSLKDQKVNMLIGSSDSVKVWLNGQLVHDHPTVRGIDGYTEFLPVTLQKGANVLLVAIYERRSDGKKEGWTGFFGFEEGTEYTVIPPGVSFTFSATVTTLLAGDTFTLNLNAENITNLAGWQADIAFDPNVLEAVEVTEGDFLKSEGDDTFFQGGTIDNTAGKITGIFAVRQSASGASGTGTLLSVTFMAKAGGETQVTLENFEFISITDDIIPTVPPNISITVGEYPAWDVNQDGRVSIQDLILVARDLGSNAPANLRTDVNRDGEINIQDLILVAQHIGESTDSSAAPTIFAIDSEELMPEMIETWIEQAQTADDGSLVFRQGIENLKRLLASLIPEKTALLANYPNPFNPETWIPYHLAKPADVTLTIYAANGAVVRTIALGHQVAGMYQSRSRAVYWDGRNAIGEPVASGIYFYTLTAGDYTATRKMLIIK